MENKICNNCGSFFIITDPDKIKHFQCTFKNMIVRPYDSYECWHQANIEREVEQPENRCRVTNRVWNPHSERHEDVKVQ